MFQADTAAQPDTVTLPDTAAQPDTASQEDLVIQPDVTLALDVATTPDMAASETAAKDTLPADAPPPVFCDSANLDLVACYRFEGSASDESSYANHGSARNVSYVTGSAGQAVRTSSNSDISVPASASMVATRSMTIELWVPPQSTLTSGRAGLVDNNGNFGIFMYPGNAVTCLAGGTSVSASSVLVVAEWTHIACIYDGANLRLYRNGAVAGSVPQTGGTPTGASAGLRIGHDNPTGSPFDGAIDGLRIWRVARPVGLLCTQPSDCG